MSTLLSELLDFDVATLSAKLRDRDISPVELTEAYLARIERTDATLRAYITVTDDLARKMAKKAEAEIVKGKWRGPLHGVPIALKDLVFTKGILTTGGSKILGDFKPDHDATVWTRLARAGAVLLGKTNLHEFAYGITSSNPHWGIVRNPYDHERIPGGSSGGSAAAIVARSAAATIGTDTGGSIRIPATLCGCVGLKPTWSRVSRYGVLPLAYTLDHAGPITRTVRDAALMLQVIAGVDRNDSTSSRERVPDYTANLERGISGMRVGVIRELNDKLSAEVSTSFNAALDTLRSLGATIDEVSIPMLRHTGVITGIITWGEALEIHEEWMRTRPQDYGDDVRRLLEIGMMTPASSYVRAQRARARALAQAQAAMADHNVLVAPGSAIVAPKIGGGRIFDSQEQAVDVIEAILRFTSGFDATGQPALAIPTGLSPEGLPVGMQIIGRPFGEVEVLQVGAAYERARGALPPPPEIQ
ncbi:MAG: amidase [Candidatus Binatus sp.]|uniref:amidase n=1 Tax=Candidatus Binatus sp. TaxID=2811406 RepID=UPI002719B00F|nr:amidase [Candidatus Binatus sp.]MDO8431955.1 amidase [Candidatus Binatus sp.]